ncbi:MAG: isocitrate lyase/phosphoenolpyruvate mutase family protein [Phycisphaerales bacterium]|nr:isocitrate lyase/phosphoenolpyruvate mutase family protein [Phycisphaerales bacterium]
MFALVRRTVIDYYRAGAAGLHIEDQQFPKRCGHLDGKALISSDHMIEKVQWAAKAARELALASSTPSAATTPAIILCARTDARGVEGLPAALDRAEAYVRAGAEMIFPEGLTTAVEFQSFARDLRARVPSVLLLANMTEFGKTPITPVSDFASWGYNVVIYPVSLLRVAMGAVTRALADIQQHGSVQPVLSQMQTRQQLYDLINYTPGVPWEMPGR